MDIFLGTNTQVFVYFIPIMNLNSPRKEGGIQAGNFNSERRNYDGL